jgi:acetyl-CoA carboxylase carboxyl transferase subunit beta
MSEPKHTNALAGETSPYLLQHAHNPVQWHPWSQSVLQKAKELDKPILLSIGYAACHWCHVMERESFEDEDIAALMNELFINIKVDREERPDLDAVYMQAVQMMTGRGGWPMTVFLTPDQVPFCCGTYFPPQARHGMPGFPRVLRSVGAAYRERKAGIIRDAEAILAELQQSSRVPATPGALTPDLLDEAAVNVMSNYDSQNGGFGGAPKFPPSMSLDFLMRCYARTQTGRYLEAVESTLPESQAMEWPLDSRAGQVIGFIVMAWFKKQNSPLPASLKDEDKTIRTEGLFIKCEGCRSVIWKKDLDANEQVCPKCNHHSKVGARDRLRMLFDEGKYEVQDQNIISTDPLKFVDRQPYAQKLIAARAATKLNDAVINASGKMGGRPALISAMEYGFIGGSMGSVMGEMLTLAVERAAAKRLPIIIISASGGARMHEGTFSLMQMAKISAALARLDDARVPFLSLLTDPTTGGVTASFAMLGDLIIAEPGALIGFAGPRVIEQTIRQKLPKGFQRSEFLLEHGMIDAIVDRRDLREYLIHALNFFLS